MRKILNQDIRSTVLWEFRLHFLRGGKEKLPHDQNGEKEKVVLNKSMRENLEACH